MDNLLFGIILLLSMTIYPTASKSTLEIEFSGFRNKKGIVWVSVYKSAEGFPKNEKLAVRKAKILLKEINTIAFHDLPYGEYAISVLHDENENEKMDFSFVGIPKEGFGFSNNAKVTFGPPSFHDAKFLLNEPRKKVSIKIRYF